MLQDRLVSHRPCRGRPGRQALRVRVVVQAGWERRAAETGQRRPVAVEVLRVRVVVQARWERRAAEIGQRRQEGPLARRYPTLAVRGGLLRPRVEAVAALQQAVAPEPPRQLPARAGLPRQSANLRRTRRSTQRWLDCRHCRLDRCCLRRARPGARNTLRRPHGPEDYGCRTYDRRQPTSSVPLALRPLTGPDRLDTRP